MSVFYCGSWAAWIYKSVRFPYPLALTFLELLITACLSQLLRVLLGLIRFTGSPHFCGDLLYGQDERPVTPSYPTWYKGLLPVPQYRDNSSEEHVAAEHGPRETIPQLRSNTLGAIGKGWRCIWTFLADSGIRGHYTILAIALTARLGLGNVLLG